MKKILSLTLAVMMVVSMIPTAFAAEAGGNWAGGTQVEATGSRSIVEDDGSVSHNAEYTITVPAKLAPGGAGTVTLEGYWPSDATVKVTAEEKVEVVSDINSADKKELAVTFASIEKAGSNTAIVTASAPVSVANIENALFGKWAGKFNYNVEYNGEAGGSGTVTPTPDPDEGGSDVVTGEAGATFSDGVTLSWDELKLDENGTKYGYNASLVTDSEIGANAFKECDSLTNIIITDGVTTIGEAAFALCDNLTSATIPVSVTNIGKHGFNSATNFTIHYSGTMEQWGTIELGSYWVNVPTEIICTDGTLSDSN